MNEVQTLAVKCAAAYFGFILFAAGVCAGVAASAGVALLVWGITLLF